MKKVLGLLILGCIGNLTLCNRNPPKSIKEKSVSKMSAAEIVAAHDLAIKGALEWTADQLKELAPRKAGYYGKKWGDKLKKVYTEHRKSLLKDLAIIKLRKIGPKIRDLRLKSYLRFLVQEKRFKLDVTIKSFDYQLLYINEQLADSSNQSLQKRKPKIARAKETAEQKKREFNTTLTSLENGTLSVSDPDQLIVQLATWTALNY